MVRLRSFVKSCFTALLLALGMGALQAQDPVFSQFGLNKNYLNPAYAGYTQSLSVGAQSRLQWMQTPGVFSTSTYNINWGCNSNKLGLALTGFDHWEGEGFLRNQALSLQSSVNFVGKWRNSALRAFRNNKYIFSGGLGLGVGQKSLDWSKLTFSDQYSHYGGFTGNPSLVRPNNETSNVIFDMSAGMKLQTGLGSRGGYLSLGAAMFHLNQPVESFFGHENVLAPRYTFHGFWYFRTRRHLKNRDPDYMSAGVVFDWQQPLLTSTYLLYKDIGNYAKVGAGFRSRSFVNINKNMDAFIFQGMVVLENLTIGYSYDLTVSNLGPQRTFGTHEIGVTYIFKKANFPWCKRKTSENCFLFLSDVAEDLQSLYIWNP